MPKFNLIFDPAVDLDVLIDNLTLKGGRVEKIHPAIGVITLTGKGGFNKVPGVIAVEKDTIIEAVACSDWHRRRASSAQLPMRAVYVPKNMGEDAVVYLIDSGVDSSHPEFAGAEIENLWSWDGTFVPDDHGTAMASAIVGQTLGLAPYAVLKSVVIPFGQSLSISLLIEAFNNILTDHLPTHSTTKVINCSWNIPKSQILDAKIAELESKNLLVVAAAGNTGSEANLLSPVGLDSVLGVGASDSFDRVVEWAPGAMSNWGPDVDLFAPGIDVTVAHHATGGYLEISGTSIAAAVTSGAVLQYIVANAGASAASLDALVMETALTDILFRNEDIYGTTPNRLLHIHGERLLLQPPEVYENNGILAQAGTVVIVGITPNWPAVSFGSAAVKVGTTPIVQPSWITQDGNNLICSVPNDLPTGIYQVYLESLDNQGNQLSIVLVRVKVFQNDPTELDAITKETYFSEESGQVVVRQSACFNYGCGDTVFGGCDQEGPEKTPCACNGQSPDYWCGEAQGGG